MLEEIRTVQQIASFGVIVDIGERHYPWQQGSTRHGFRESVAQSARGPAGRNQDQHIGEREGAGARPLEQPRA